MATSQVLDVKTDADYVALRRRMSRLRVQNSKQTDDDDNGKTTNIFLFILIFFYYFILDHILVPVLSQDGEHFNVMCRTILFMFNDFRWEEIVLMMLVELVTITV
jgi:hypothetical protein